ncbi:hypothetical protein [Streptomyces sp. NPDC020597]|uniref:hypothetical protein n=1 Tax=Streptomyces sp. NPDC020597 TaxID=3365080 RepID=UPI0037B44119
MPDAIAAAAATLAPRGGPAGRRRPPAAPGADVLVGAGPVRFAAVTPVGGPAAPVH